ncbi:MAG TPA: CAP domain-containing protein [Chroococcidiopsis sp.]
MLKPPDLAGSSLRKARELTLGRRTTVVNEFLGGSDRVDFYKLNTKNRSSFRVDLQRFKTNIDVELIQDLNKNGKVERGEVLATSRNLGKLPESINIVGLERGTFYLRVYNRSRIQTPYRLSAAAGALPSNPAATFAYDVVTATNALRKQYGLTAFAINTQLTKAAQLYSQQMALGDFIGSTAPDGATPETRIRQAGYIPTWWGENVAVSYPTPTEVVNAWINSDIHRRNILSPELREVGVGYYYLANDTGVNNWNVYWTQLFGSPSA